MISSLILFATNVDSSNQPGHRIINIIIFLVNPHIHGRLLWWVQDRIHA